MRRPPGRAKWPSNAASRFEVRATPEQHEKWHAAACVSACYDVDAWLAKAADFAAWWIKREGELLVETEARLAAEARERGGHLLEAPCQD